MDLLINRIEKNPKSKHTYTAQNPALDPKIISHLNARKSAQDSPMIMNLSCDKFMLKIVRFHKYTFAYGQRTDRRKHFASEPTAEEIGKSGIE